METQGAFGAIGEAVEGFRLPMRDGNRDLKNKWPRAPRGFRLPMRDGNFRCVDCILVEQAGF